MRSKVAPDGARAHRLLRLDGPSRIKRAVWDALTKG